MRPVKEISAEIKKAHNADDFARMLELADELVDNDGPWARSTEYQARAQVSAYAGKTDEATAWFQRAIDAAHTDVNAIGEARARINYAYMLMRTGNLTEAREQFEGASELSDQVNDIDVQEMATAGVGMVLSNQGRTSEALEYHEKALALSKQQKSGAGIAANLGNIAIVHAIQRDFANALRFFEQARAQYQENGDESGDANIVYNIGMVYHEASNYVEAIKRFQEAYDIHERLGLHAAATRIKLTLGTAYAEIDNPESASQHLRQVIPQLEEIGDKSGLAAAYSSLGNLALRRGDYTEARVHVNEALNLQTTMQAQHGIATQHGLLAEIALEQEDLPAASEHLATAMSAQDLPQGSLIELGVLKGRLLLAQGDAESGITQLKNALDLAEDSAFRSQVLKVNELLRDHARTVGDLEGYIAYNDVCTKLTEEIRGKDVGIQVAMQKVEREAAAERQEREKEQALLYGALPESIAKRMIAGEDVSGDQYDHASVMFVDIVDFTKQSSSLESSEVTHLLEEVFDRFDELCEEHGVTKIKTIGDSYMAVGFTDPEKSAAAALEMISAKFTWPNGSPLQYRIGIHFGAVTAGVIGKQRLQYDVWGDTVNTASRMESTGEAGRIHCSDSFAGAIDPDCNDVGSSALRAKDDSDDKRFVVLERGEIEIKGKGTMTTYWLEGA